MPVKLKELMRPSKLLVWKITSRTRKAFECEKLGYNSELTVS